MKNTTEISTARAVLLLSFAAIVIKGKNKIIHLNKFVSEPKLTVEP